MKMILDAVDQRALQDLILFGLSRVVYLGCSGCLILIYVYLLIFIYPNIITLLLVIH